MIVKQKTRDILTGILGLLLALLPLSWYLLLLQPTLSENFFFLLMWIHLPLPLYYHYVIRNKPFYIACISTYVIANITNLVLGLVWYHIASNYQAENSGPLSVFAMVLIGFFVILIAGTSTIALVITGISVLFRVRKLKRSKRKIYATQLNNNL